MKSFWLGLLVGAAFGAGGAYAALETPWKGGGDASAAATADAGTDEVASNDGKRRRRRKRRHRGRNNEVLGDPIVELTAADRKLVWRGPRVELAPRDVDFSAGDQGRSLDQSEIDAGIASRADAIVDCIEQARGNAELAATITLEALVEGDGRVSRSRVRAPKYLMDNGAASCIQREARAMRFAATGAQTVVSVPFDLR